MGRQNERTGPLGCGRSRGLFALTRFPPHEIRKKTGVKAVWRFGVPEFPHKIPHYRSGISRHNENPSGTTLPVLVCVSAGSGTSWEVLDQAFNGEGGIRTLDRSCLL